MLRVFPASTDLGGVFRWPDRNDAVVDLPAVRFLSAGRICRASPLPGPGHIFDPFNHPDLYGFDHPTLRPQSGRLCHTQIHQALLLLYINHHL